MVERLGEHTQDISSAMRDYLDNFRHPAVTTKSARITASLDQHSPLREAIDGRTQTLNEALGSRVMDIAKTMAEGGKEVVARSTAHRRRHRVINVRGAKLAESIGGKIDDIDKTLGVKRWRCGNWTSASPVRGASDRPRHAVTRNRGAQQSAADLLVARRAYEAVRSEPMPASGRKQ